MAFRSIIIALLCLSTFIPFSSSVAQEQRVNHRKIEREREKKQKQAQKDYNQAVKRHKKMQSKETKASMKRSKREAVKLTPLRP